MIRFLRCLDWLDCRLIRHRWDGLCRYVAFEWLKAGGEMSKGADYYDDKTKG